MPRKNTLIHMLLAFTLLVAAATAGADMLVPAAVKLATVIDIGSTGATRTLVATDGRVVFRNRVTGITRILFSSENASAFDCRADGDAVVRSRSSQYVLRGGAELSCTVRPGSYRYTTLTQRGGGVQMTRSTLRVRN